MYKLESSEIWVEKKIDEHDSGWVEDIRVVATREWLESRLSRGTRQCFSGIETFAWY